YGAGDERAVGVAAHGVPVAQSRARKARHHHRSRRTRSGGQQGYARSRKSGGQLRTRYGDAACLQQEEAGSPWFPGVSAQQANSGNSSDRKGRGRKRPRRNLDAVSEIQDRAEAATRSH